VLRGAILGAGNVAIHGHVPGWLARKDVTIRAAADPRPAGRAALSERLPEVVCYGSAEEMLENESLDFVDICAPPAMHAPLIAASLAKGRHVLCEKPLVLSPEELTPLADLARESGLVLATVHNWRYSPILAAAGELLRAGAAGELLSCRWETLRERPAAAAGDDAANWRVDPSISGGGVLMDHGWHALYVVSGWLPEPPCRVSARLSTRRHHDWPVEDTAEVFLESSGGARAEIFLTWAAQERRNRVTIEGTRATIRLDGNALEIVPRGSPRPAESRRFAQSLSDGSHHPDWFGSVAAEFLAAIADPSRRRATLEEASLCLDVIALARESSRRGGQPLPVAVHNEVDQRARERSVAT
jgi:predicted dehydrogenase